MELLRKQMYKAIELYGLRDRRTIELSKKLDKLVSKEQRKYAKRNNH